MPRAPGRISGVVHWRAPALWVLVAVIMSGCAAMIRHPEPPQVTLTGISLTRVGLLEQGFRVTLRLQNPNNFELPLDGFQVDLTLNGRPFLSGTSVDSVTLPRLGSASVEMDATSKLAGLLQQLQGIASGETHTVHYTLTGKIYVVRPVLSLPLKEEGEFDISRLEQLGD